MPYFAQYLIKLSLSLGVVYLFYWLVLRRLTFYSWNRWYLLGYSLLAFAIPFVNIASLLDQSDWRDSGMVQLIPVMDSYYGAGNAAAVTGTPSSGPDGWVWALLLVGAGILIMLVRLGIQYLSFRRIRRASRLLLDAPVKVYQVDKPIIPFSFGKSIFINQHLHSEAELREIIGHEFVHVRQRHTVDIIWSELLCMLNWYNPFAWLIRRDIRQNLEFITDQQVLQNGVDKKQYQYLLLKVIGVSEFRMGAAFNFSSLRKRIAMMNRGQSARIHLIRFLFILPLIAVLLLAFREQLQPSGNDRAAGDGYLRYAGLVMDAATLQPISGVAIQETSTGEKVISDAKGFFKLAVPMTATGQLALKCTFQKAGYNTITTSNKLTLQRPDEAAGLVDYVGITPLGSLRTVPSFVNGFGRLPAGSVPADPSYEEVVAPYVSFMAERKEALQLFGSSADSDKPYHVVNGRSYLLADGHSWARTNRVTNIVFVNNKRMTGEEVNRTIKRSEIGAVASVDRQSAKAKYGIDQPVLEAYTTLHVVYTTDTVPAARATAVSLHREERMDAAHKAFFERNPDVLLLHWEPGKSELQVYRNKKRVDIYNLSDSRQVAKAESRYGPLPAPASGAYRDNPPAAAKETPLDTVIVVRATVSPSEQTAKEKHGYLTVVSRDTVRLKIAPLFVLNGHPLPADAKLEDYVSQDQIERIDVLKDKHATEVYGVKGANGVVEVYSKKKPAGVTLRYTITDTVKPVEKEDGKIMLGHFDGLCIVDGKEYDAAGLRKLNLLPADIRAIDVLKDESAVQRYGEKGKKGVIIITTKKASPRHESAVDSSGIRPAAAFPGA